MKSFNLEIDAILKNEDDAPRQTIDQYCLVLA